MVGADTLLPSCLPFLISHYNKFTKSEQRIANYISKYPHDAIRQTISEIAENTRSSEVTVSRFCHKAGYSGLQDLKIALASEIFTPLESVCQEINTADSFQKIAIKVFSNITTGLQDTLKLLDFNAISRAIDAIYTAHKVDVYGLGISAVVAHDIENHLLRFAKPVRAFSDIHMQITSAALLSPEDVVIVISHTGSNLDLLQSVKLAKKNQATIIAITSYRNSPLNKIADIVIYGRGREVNYRAESTASRLVHLAIADLLYTGLVLKDPERFTNNVKKMRLEIAKRRS